MKCKPGQLAYITHSPLGMNQGRVVECVRIVGAHSEFGPVWRVQSKGRQLVTELGIVCVACDVPDAWLTPINDADPDTSDSGVKNLEAA